MHRTGRVLNVSKSEVTDKISKVDMCKCKHIRCFIKKTEHRDIFAVKYSFFTLFVGKNIPRAQLVHQTYSYTYPIDQPFHRCLGHDQLLELQLY